jgi:hypothetical protein
MNEGNKPVGLPNGKILYRKTEKEDEWGGFFIWNWGTFFTFSYFASQLGKVL